MPWTFPVSLDPGDPAPLFLQIARAIADDVARGRLRAGAPLPGTRTLARSLGVHRNTVVAAYAELATQGWVLTRQGGATRVAGPPASERPRPFAGRAWPRPGVPPSSGFAVEALSSGAPIPDLPAGTLALWGGVPDLRLVPHALIGRAWRRAARLQGRRLLSYAEDLRGLPRLREALAAMLSTSRGLAAQADDVLVVRGAQMALDLVARALLRPGDVVAVEAMGYQRAWAALRRAGADLRPVPVDGDGLDVEALERLCARTPVRLVYVTPHHQYPTTVSLAPARRLRLLALAHRHRIAILEDDYDHEFHYDGRPVLPLASADRAGVVVYVGSLAKILAPGLRIGFVVAPRDLLARLVAERAIVDRQGDHVLEAAIAELLEDGEIPRHVRRARRAYLGRRDAFVAALRRRLGDALSFRVPPGGMSIWARTARGVDVDVWQARALTRGVYFQTARDFTFDGRAAPFARLGYGVADERALADAAGRLARALPGC